MENHVCESLPAVHPDRQRYFLSQSYSLRQIEKNIEYTSLLPYPSSSLLERSPIISPSLEGYSGNLPKKRETFVLLTVELPIINTKLFLPKPVKMTGLQKYVIIEYFYIY